MRTVLASVAVTCIALGGGGCQQARDMLTFHTAPAAPTTMPAPAAQDSLAVAFFHDHLAKFGQWVDSAEYGAVWYPSDVAPTWRPYVAGRWIYNDGCGWIWMGGERWSWATDHYGRWIFLDDYGWVWVPGRQWSPAWVAWRAGSGYVGWAPLYQRDDVDVTTLTSDGLPPFAFIFVPKEHFTDANAAAHVEPFTRNVTLVALAADTTHYEMVDRRIINHGVDVKFVEEVLSRPIRRYHLIDHNLLRPAEIIGDDLAVYRPAITDLDPTALHLPPAREPQFNADLVSEQRLQLDDYHSRLRQQMLQRQAHELSSTQNAKAKSDLMARQEQERLTFDDQRQREIEALRRRQREQRERLAARPAAQPRPPQSAPGQRYEIPPEWQLSREMGQPPPAAPHRAISIEDPDFPVAPTAQPAPLAPRAPLRPVPPVHRRRDRDRTTV